MNNQTYAFIGFYVTGVIIVLLLVCGLIFVCGTLRDHDIKITQLEEQLCTLQNKR